MRTAVDPSARRAAQPACTKGNNDSISSAAAARSCCSKVASNRRSAVSRSASLAYAWSSSGAYGARSDSSLATSARASRSSSRAVVAVEARR